MNQLEPTKTTIAKISVHVYRFPIENSVVTSFGQMNSRPAVFVRLEDTDGGFGWGEVFANWPAAGAEHRARLVDEDVRDLVLGRTFTGRNDLFNQLQEKTYIRALQCGEWGPFNSVIAGLDIALYDLLARNAGLPIRKFLNPHSADHVRAYASGIFIGDAEKLIENCRAKGFKDFKVKVGFELDGDVHGVSSILKNMRSSETLRADANQAWDVEMAVRFANRTEGLTWLEEPLRADLPVDQWQKVAQATDTPLAAGENMSGEGAFTAAAKSGVFGVLQPDVAKCGGFTGCLRVCKSIRQEGRLYCPHFLGGGIGLAASAHLLAADGGSGMLEVDCNPNPLREAMGPMQGNIENGILSLGNKPGLGVDTLPEEIEQYNTRPSK